MGIFNFICCGDEYKPAQDPHRMMSPHPAQYPAHHHNHMNNSPCHNPRVPTPRPDVLDVRSNGTPRNGLHSCLRHRAVTPVVVTGDPHQCPRSSLAPENPFKRNGNDSWSCGGNAGHMNHGAPANCAGPGGNNVQMPCQQVPSGPSNPIPKPNTPQGNYGNWDAAGNNVCQMGMNNNGGNPMACQMPPGPNSPMLQPNNPQGNWDAAGNNAGQMRNMNGAGNPMASQFAPGPSNSMPNPNNPQGNCGSWGAAGNNAGQMDMSNNGLNPMASQQNRGASSPMPRPNNPCGNHVNWGAAHNNAGTYPNQSAQQQAPNLTHQPGNNINNNDPQQTKGGSYDDGHGQGGSIQTAILDGEVVSYNIIIQKHMYKRGSGGGGYSRGNNDIHFKL